MATPQPSKSGVGDKFNRQGHTAGPYGNEPSKDAKGEPGQAPRPLKP